MGAMAVPQEFDPYTQQFNLTGPDGSTFTVSMDAIDSSRIYVARLSTTYGAQIGATVTLLFVLLLLTRSEKRKSSIFIINALCLVTDIVRCILLSCYPTSTLLNPYTQLSGDYSGVTSRDLATTVTTNVFTLLVTILVFISLSMQVWVVCITTAPIQRHMIMGATTIVALAATGYKATYVILNIQETLNFERPSFYHQRIYQESYIVQAVAIWFFSCIFTYKLGHAIYQRRKLRMPQFGPMQIVFIMGCQTMFIPAIFTCLQFRSEVVELGVVVLTIVCLFLPFSAMWAGVVNETVVPASGPKSTHQLIRGEFYRSAPKSTIENHSSTTMMERTRQMSVCTCGAKSKGTDSTGGTPVRKKRVPEYEDDAIHIGREFGLSHNDAGDRV